MNILRHLLVLITLMLSSDALAQAIETTFDKKVIHTDSLNLPNNTSASTLITLLPELLQRPGFFQLSNYDIMVEDMSVGTAADVALYQLHIADIEKIEVSESPISSYQNNGQGGCINIVLRSSSSNDKDHWGNVSFLAYSSVDMSSQASVGFKTRNFMLRGILLAESYDGSSEARTLRYKNGSFLDENNVARDSRFRTQLARAYMQYDITPRDRLKFDVSELFTYNKSFDVNNFDILNQLTQRTRAVTLQTHLFYKHSTARGSFVAEFEYDYTPSWDKYGQPSVYSYRKDSKGDVLSGKLEYKTLLFGAPDTQSLSRGELALGTNFNTSLRSETAYIHDHTIVSGDIVREVPKNDTKYVMPYMTFNTTLGRFRLKASAEYQRFTYTYDRIGETYSAVSNDFTGKIMTEWHFTPTSNLRFIIDRKLQRPEPGQLYPYRTLDITRRMYTEGNPDLKPMMLHEFMLDYIQSSRLAPSHDLTFSAGASISRVTDIIGENIVSSSPSSGLGQTLTYLSFQNQGYSTIASANLMALYTHNAFTLSFAGNVYNKTDNVADTHDHYTYYNLSLNPVFRLKDGWQGGAHLVYYSPVKRHDGTLGDSALANITVGKTLNRFYIYLTERVSLTDGSPDITTVEGIRTEQKTFATLSYAGIGVKYTF